MASTGAIAFTAGLAFGVPLSSPSQAQKGNAGLGAKTAHTSGAPPCWRACSRSECVMHRQPSGSLLVVAVRIILYFLAVAGVSVLFLQRGTPVHGDIYYSEGSLAEWVEIALLLLMIVALNWAAAIDRAKRPVTTLITGFLVATIIREFDSPLDEHVFDGAWQTGVSVTLIAMGVYGYRHRRALRPAVEDFVTQPAFGLMLAGTLTILVYAQVLGRNDFWQMLMGDKYVRSVRNAMEEGAESLGYVLILIGAVEYLYATYARLRAGAR